MAKYKEEIPDNPVKPFDRDAVRWLHDVVPNCISTIASSDKRGRMSFSVRYKENGVIITLPDCKKFLEDTYRRKIEVSYVFFKKHGITVTIEKKKITIESDNRYHLEQFQQEFKRLSQEYLADKERRKPSKKIISSICAGVLLIMSAIYKVIEYFNESTDFLDKVLKMINKD